MRRRALWIGIGIAALLVAVPVGFVVMGGDADRIEGALPEGEEPTFEEPVEPEAPTISIGNVSVNEGAVTADFSVTLSQAAAAPVGVSYATTDAKGACFDARADRTLGDGTTEEARYPDNQKPSGTLAFAPGETRKTVSVRIENDLIDECDENFAVTLSAPTGGAELGTSGGTGTITDDDPAPTVLVTVLENPLEGNRPGDLTPVRFVITAQGRGAHEINGIYEFNSRDANPAATAGEDYAPGAPTLRTRFLLVPDPGSGSYYQQGPFTVAVVQDLAFELDEVFFVDTIEVRGAKPSRARVTIRNDDVEAAK